MAHMTTGNLITAVVFFVVMIGVGSYLLFFARRICDFTITQLQKRWPVLFYRTVGACIIAGSAFIAWSATTQGLAPASKIELRPVAMHEPGEPLVQDAQSAIRIARALKLAQRPNNRAIFSEAQWQENCQAKLVDGVWHVTPKVLVASHNHPDITGPAPLFCSGAAVFNVGAQDGRFLGEIFAD